MSIPSSISHDIATVRSINEAHRKLLA